MLLKWNCLGSWWWEFSFSKLGTDAENLLKSTLSEWEEVAYNNQFCEFTNFTLYVFRFLVSTWRGVTIMSLSTRASARACNGKIIGPLRRMYRWDSDLDFVDCKCVFSSCSCGSAWFTELLPSISPRDNSVMLTIIVNASYWTVRLIASVLNHRDIR